MTTKLLCCSMLAVCLCQTVTSPAATLDTHAVKFDGAGKIIPWTGDPGLGYDRVMYLSWDLLKNHMPLDPANGLPVTYTHSEYDPTNQSGSSWPNNPASKNASLADSAGLYYAYSGDYSVVTLVRGLLDHQLQYGTTPTNYSWAGVPWSSAAASSVSYGNDALREGVGVLAPDKVGELGYYGYLKFYELTGGSNYLKAAIACADALASHVRDGDATHSPWPYRVVAQTGVTSQEEYSAHAIGPIQLFDELMRLGLGNTNAYGTARQKAWNWLMKYPMTNGVWVNYSEDVGPLSGLSNFTQFIPGYTARYLLEHPELDPDWYGHVTNLLGFVETTFGGTDNGEAGLQYGARVISEQIEYKFKMASHTSRFGCLNAMLYAATGDEGAREKGYRSLNWSTYMCRSNGVVIEGPAEFAWDPTCWFTDGHGDYIRHFMLALGAVPEWAPEGQNHITGSSSVIQSVTYATNGQSIAYTTFDAASTEALRVGFVPGGVLVNGTVLAQRADLSQPGWVYNPTNGVLRVRHDSGRDVQILSETASNQPPTITTTSLPDGTLNTPYSAALAANGGTPPYAYSIASGGLPPGLTLGTNTAQIAGMPTASGAFSFAARVSDMGNPVQSATQALSIFIKPMTTTVGNTNTGTVTDVMGASWINAGRYQAGATLSVTTVFAQVGAVTGKYKCAIYTDDAGQPSRLLVASAELSNPGTGWNAFPLASMVTLTNGQYYWLAIWSDSAGSKVYYSDTGGTLRWGFYSYGTWPDPIDTTGGGSVDYCIYVLGTPLPVQPEILSIGVTNGIVGITWSAVPGWNYVVEHTGVFGNPTWFQLPPVLATNMTATATNAVADSSQQMYRVRLVY